MAPAGVPPGDDRPVATAVVIPAGPRDDVADTLDSVLFYVPRPRLVVIVNDTGRPAVDRLAERDPDVVIVPAPAGLPRGTYGGLWAKTASAYHVVLDRGGFEVVIRLDADALFVGPGIEVASARRFAAEPRLGLLGAYRIGPDGGRRDWTPAARQLRSEIGLRGLRKPRLRAGLQPLLARATAQGYEHGAHALGTSVLSPRLLAAWKDRGWLDVPWLARSRLNDDMIAGLLAAAAGFEVGEMGGPDDLLAVTWRGLPDAPDALLAAGKAIVHSVRSYRDWDEEHIREHFRSARRSDAAARAAASE